MSSTKIIVNVAWADNAKREQPDGDFDNFGLTENAKKIARKELREDKSSREQSLQQLREWLRKNEDVENIRSDDSFLLRFLRVKKFSVPMAQLTILKYLNLRRVFPHIAANLDFLDPTLNDIISSGYVFVSPIRDRAGRRVVVMNFGKFDPKIYNGIYMAKANILAYEALLDDPENQVLGITHVGDVTGVTTAHITSWKPSEFGRVMKWGEQSIPLRYKDIHLINLPSSVKWVVDFVKVTISAKMKDRFHTYTNFKVFEKTFDTFCLPQEMGGKMPMADMIELWKHELASKRERLLALDKMKLLNDHSLYRKYDNRPDFYRQIDNVSGSFRKLEID